MQMMIDNKNIKERKGMTDTEKIARISEMLEEFDFCDIDEEDFENEIMEQTLSATRDELWALFCLVSDLIELVNGGDAE